MTETRSQRRLAAVLAADIVGYSRLVRADEEGTVQRVRAVRREVVDPRVAKHAGRVVKLMGDGILIEFPSAVDAVRCAVEVQQAMALRDAGLPDAERLAFRIGINIGDVLIDGEDIQGDGVNLAARLEGIAPPGGLFVSDGVHEQVRDRTGFGFLDLGERELRNIDRPLRVWAWEPGGDETVAAGAAAPGEFSLPERPSIAVLPFQNISGDPEQEWFADGIAEDIITALSRIEYFFVIARNSSFTYKGRAVDVKQVGRELGVRYVLEGSVRRAGQRLRVTAQLIDATTGAHVWAERYDRELDDIFDVQDEITRNVVASTQTQIDLAEGALASTTGRPSLPAWMLARRALALEYEMSRESLAECVRLAEEAIAVGPGSGLACFALASGLFHTVWMGYAEDAPSLLARCRNAADDAIRVDRNNEYAHWIRGMVRLLDGEHDGAIASIERALEINPNCSVARGSLATVLNFAGRPADAIAANEIAIRSNPRDPTIFYRYSGLAISHFLLSGFDTAVEWARRAVNLKAEWSHGHMALIAALVEAGRGAEARRALAHYVASCPGASLAQVAGLPFRDPRHRLRFVQALRATGCPADGPNPAATP